MQLLRNLICSFIILFICSIASKAQTLTPKFSASVTQVCGGAFVEFKDETVGSVKRSWNFGGGAGNINSTTVNPVKIPFNITGKFTVTLTAFNSAGVSSAPLVKKDYIVVIPNPVVDFSADRTTICKGSTVQFTDKSSAASGSSINSYLWNFGDNTSGSPLKNPSHKYNSSDGAISVTLTVFDSKGCSTIVTKPLITQIARPGATFTPTKLPTGCSLPSSITFAGSDGGPNATYFWQFGDGQTSDLRNPPVNHKYTAVGTYHVKYFVTNAGCTDSIVKEYKVFDPKPNFTIVGTKHCVGEDVQFLDASSSDITSRSWEFGDGLGSGQKDPRHKYENPGKYTVAGSFSTDFCGAVPTKSQTIEIEPKPIISFTPSSVSDCTIPSIIKFDDTTPNAVSRKWTFLDTGDTTSIKSPSHSYSKEGVFSVKLDVTDINGCKNTLTSNSVNIKYPKALATPDKTKGCLPLKVKFQDRSTSVEPITSWAWDFGDGGTSDKPSPEYTYQTLGSFKVKLTIVNDKGCTSTYEFPTAITPGTKPDVKFGVDKITGCYPLKVSFLDSSSSNVDEWLWNFGDKQSASVKNPVHTYSLDSGFFDVRLIASFNGCPDTLNKPKYIYVKSPIARFNSSNPVGCNFPYAVTFRDSSKAANKWFWDFGDAGTTDTSTLQYPPAYTYKNPGFYKLKLVVTNTSNGCKDSLERIDYVKVSDIDTAFTEDNPVGCSPFKVKFTDASVSNSPIKNWEWHFGDGSIISGSGNINSNIDGGKTTGTFAAPSHIFTDPNTFSVKLIVTNNLDCRDSILKSSLLLIKPIPVADFDVNTNKGCAPLPVLFTDKSTGPEALDKWEWKFGDDSVSTSQNPGTHIYKAKGTYKAQLKVTDVQGCSDTATRVIVPTFPVPDFQFKSIACNDQDVLFTDNSSGIGLNYKWNFGDGSAESISKSPTYKYHSNVTDTFPVVLELTDINGCRDSRTKDILISVPVADFTTDGSILNCFPNPVKFTDASLSKSTPNDSIVSRTWNFGDPASGISNEAKDLLNPEHVYGASGKYTVELNVVNVHNCKATKNVKDLINVGGPTVISMSYPSIPTNCGPVTVEFNVVGSNIAKYKWVFGDLTDTVTTVGTIRHTYTSGGDIKPFVVVEDSLDKTIPNDKVCESGLLPFIPFNLPGPVVDFSPDSVFKCEATEVQFQNLTPVTGVESWEWDFGDNSTKETTLNPKFHNYSKQGSYDVKLTAIVKGCPFFKTKHKSINIFTPPSVKFAMEDTLGCRPLPVTFKVDTSSIPFLISKWTWNFKDGISLQIEDSSRVYSTYNTIHTYMDGGIYYPEFSVFFKEFGCEANYKLNQKVEVLSAPAIGFNVEPIIEENVISNFNFTNSTTGATKYLWIFGDGQTSTVVNPSHYYTKEGTYTVQLISENAIGCKDTLEKVVKAVSSVKLFNAFTPNHDGVNDKFIVDIPGDIKKFSLSVYDRWGRLVFEDEDYKNDWEGKDKNGKDLGNDTYFYVLNFDEKFVWNGYISLFR